MKLKTIPLIASISLVVLGVGIFGFLEKQNKLLHLRHAHQHQIHEHDRVISVPISKSTILPLLAVGVFCALSVHRKNKPSRSTSQNNSSQTSSDLKFGPFCKPTGKRYFWSGKSHLKAIETLRKALEGDANFIILSGDSGVGKTTLIKYLKKELLPEYISIEAENEFQDAKDLFMLIARHIGIGGNYVSKGAFFVRFDRYLHNLQDENKKILLIFDDFAVTDDKLIKELTFLSNIKIRHQKLIKILFSGENISFSPSEPDKSTNSLVARCRLEPLNRSETNSYIDYKLQTAGINNRIFPTVTRQNIFLYSQGIPQDINKICDCALNLGHEKELWTVEPAVIEKCCQKLHLLSRGQATHRIKISQKVEREKDLLDQFFNRFKTIKLPVLPRNFADINKQTAIDSFRKAKAKTYSFIQGAAKNFFIKQRNYWDTKISISKLFDSYLWNSALALSSVALALAFALWYQGIFPDKSNAPRYIDFRLKYDTPESGNEIFYDEKIIRSLEQFGIRATQQFTSYKQLTEAYEQKKLKPKLLINEPDPANAAYFIQVGAFLHKKNAAKAKRMLNKKGYSVRIVEFKDSKGRLWHTVRIGEYASLKIAKKHAADFSSQEKMDSIVLPLRQP